MDHHVTNSIKRLTFACVGTSLLMCIINIGISQIGIVLMKNKRKERKGKEEKERKEREEKRRMNPLCLMCDMSPFFHTDS